jgi:hypothetical protein
MLPTLKDRTVEAILLPSTDAFAIHGPVTLSYVMPKYFRMSRSFQRQLNLYDFQRSPEGLKKVSSFICARPPDPFHDDEAQQDQQGVKNSQQPELVQGRT